MGLPSASARRRLSERVGLLEALDEGADDVGVVVVDEIGDVVLDREPGLVAARDDVADPDAALLHQVLGDRMAEAAALGHDAHGARSERLRHVGAEGRRAQSDIEDAVAVRPADEEPVIRREALELGLALLALGAGLGESTREHDGPTHSVRHGGSQHVRHLLRWNRDDDAVRALRRGAEVGIAGKPEDLGVSRIDRENFPDVAEALQIGDDPCRAGQPLRGADDRDARRLHQGRQVHGPPTMAEGSSVSTRQRRWPSAAEVRES
jgi:hypothetical protein